MYNTLGKRLIALQNWYVNSSTYKFDVSVIIWNLSACLLDVISDYCHLYVIWSRKRSPRSTRRISNAYPWRSDKRFSFAISKNRRGARRRSESTCHNIDVSSIRPNGLGSSSHKWPTSLPSTGSDGSYCQSKTMDSI